jgi:tetratricopeptide (TPR) repeat protein
MQAERLKLLKGFLEEEPNDPFNSYVLALEYLKSDLKESKFYFESLLEKFPDYLATYYHAAALFGDLEMIEEAKKTYLKGIDLAILQKNTKTELELKKAFQSFLELEDL